jgi:hypothetical protein
MSIALTRISRRGVQSVRVDDFPDAKDLGSALLTSGCIPLVIHDGLLPRLYRGEGYYDGGITDNTPVFHDNLRPQLVVKFLTIREGIIYYTPEEMVGLVEMGITELAELVRDGNTNLRRPHNLTLLDQTESYTEVHSVVPPRFCCKPPEMLAGGSKLSTLGK